MTTELSSYLILENLKSFFPINIPGQRVDKKEFVKAVLTYVGKKYTLVPELLEILSVEDTFKVLHVFSGQKLSIPDKQSVEAGLRDIYIYFNLVLTPTTDELRNTAKQYNLTTQSIRLIVDKISKVLDQPNPLKNVQD